MGYVYIAEDAKRYLTDWEYSHLIKVIADFENAGGTVYKVKQILIDSRLYTYRLIYKDYLTANEEENLKCINVDDNGDFKDQCIMVWNITDYIDNTINNSHSVRDAISYFLKAYGFVIYEGQCYIDMKDLIYMI